jgi:protein KTI12
MPLVVLVGIPCSGKTRISLELKSFFESQGLEVELVNEEALQIDKVSAYSNNFDEKNLRAALKSAVERKLTKEKIVILDSMNYIKGYRYELFCIVRQVKTCLCVVYMDITKDQALVHNSTYPVDLFNDLSNRMEVPNQKNKWDSPLIILREGEEVPSSRIFDILIKGRTLTENMATVKAPSVVQDYVYLADQAVQKTLEFIIQAQEEYNEGALIDIPETSSKYLYIKKLSMLQLKKSKQQFLKINKSQPCSIERCADSFIEYLNSNMA